MPEPTHARLGLQVGKMLAWELMPSEDRKQQFAVYPDSELGDLAGCLSSEVLFTSIAEETQVVQKVLTKSATGRYKRSQRR